MLFVNYVDDSEEGTHCCRFQEILITTKSMELQHASIHPISIFPCNMQHDKQKTSLNIPMKST